MNGKVFQTHDEREKGGQFDITKEKLIEYVSSKFHASHEGKIHIAEMLDTMEEADIPDAVLTGLTTAVQDYRVIQVEKKRDAYAIGKAVIFPIIWGQCSLKMRSRLKSTTTFAQVKIKNDSLLLLRMIQSVSYRFQTHRQPMSTFLANDRVLKNHIQKPGDSIKSYYKVMKSHFDAIIHFCGGAPIPPLFRAMAMTTDSLDLTAALALIDKLACTPEQFRTAEEKAGELWMASMLIQQADSGHFGELQTRLINTYAQIQAQGGDIDDPYPQTLEAAKSLLENFVPTPSRTRTPPTSDKPGQHLAFAQVSGNWMDNVTCYRCQQLGHLAGTCTNDSVQREVTPPTEVEPPEETMNALVDHEDEDFGGGESSICCASTDNKDHLIDSNWILLDSASTVNMFSNPNFLKNVRDSEGGCTIHSNGGASVAKKVGDLPGFGTVWLNEGGIGNVLSMASVAKIYRITQDNEAYEGVIVRPGMEPLHFMPSRRGLYYYDATPAELNATSSSFNQYSYNLVTTVSQNLDMFTRRQRSKIVKAKKVFELLGRPAHSRFLEMINQNQLPHCPVTADDANNFLAAWPGHCSPKRKDDPGHSETCRIQSTDPDRTNTTGRAPRRHTR